MAKPANQLAMDLTGVVEASKPFEIVDRQNYDITPEVLEPFRDEGKKGLAVLRLAEYGFLSTEVSRLRMGLHDLGVPHRMLMGMTEAEAVALYSGIGRLKSGKLSYETFSGKPLENCISELVKDSFGFIPGTFQQVAQQQKVEGYDTKPGGLLDRMRCILSEEPSFRVEFRKSALSTFRILDKDRRYVWGCSFDDLVDDLTGLFKGKYQRAASQPINNRR